MTGWLSTFVFLFSQIAEEVGPHAAVVKTHSDIVTDWTADVGSKLRELAKRYNFLVMEDR